MNNRMKNQINKARKAGISNVDLMRMKEVAKKEAKKMETDAVEKSISLYVGNSIKRIGTRLLEQNSQKESTKIH